MKDIKNNEIEQKKLSSQSLNRNKINFMTCRLSSGLLYRIYATDCYKFKISFQYLINYDYRFVDKVFIAVSLVSVAC